MTTHTRWWRGLALGAAAITTLALAACAPAGSTANSSASSAPSTVQSSGTAAGSSSAAEPTESATSGSGKEASGTFVVARTGDIDKVDPQLATAFQTVATLRLVYETLLTTDDNGKLVPGLATAWKLSDDGKTVTFTLRDGVTWQDGDPFTSADVKASLERILDEKTAAVGRSNIAAIDSIDTPDDGTVVLHLSATNASIL